jgi:hypothetical protein
VVQGKGLTNAFLSNLEQNSTGNTNAVRLRFFNNSAQALTYYFVNEKKEPDGLFTLSPFSESVGVAPDLFINTETNIPWVIKTASRQICVLTADAGYVRDKETTVYTDELLHTTVEIETQLKLCMKLTQGGMDIEQTNNIESRKWDDPYVLIPEMAQTKPGKS